jgi:D-alanyl-D-alanine carboxypeptidase
VTRTSAVRGSRVPALFLSILILVSTAGPAAARAGWKSRIDRLVAGRAAAVSVAGDGETFYSHRPRSRNVPASNEKLLLSMALLNELDPEFRIETTAVVTSSAAGVVPGDLWILGHGDPTLTSGGGYARQLSELGPTRLGGLAREIRAAGIRRIQGSIVGSTGYFERDWWAPGWDRDFPAEEIPIPTSLTFNGNQHRGRHVVDPERRAATWLTKKLRSLGVRVGGRPRAGRPPAENTVVATIYSKKLAKLMRYMNRNSSNFFAEVLGKRLARETFPGWGSIDKAGRAIEAYAGSEGVTVEANDSSGLSYSNHVSSKGLAKLLRAAGNESWGAVLMSTLPGYGEGTLEDRSSSVRMRAKTGTLESISSLSGWVWLQQSGSWGEFSILSHGTSKYEAAQMEDRIVRLIARYAGPRTNGRAAGAGPIAAATTSIVAAAIARVTSSGGPVV